MKKFIDINEFLEKDDVDLIDDLEITRSIKKCKFCAEEIQDQAVKCKHCGSDLNEYSIDEYEEDIEDTDDEDDDELEEEKPPTKKLTVFLVIIIWLIIIIFFFNIISDKTYSKVFYTQVVANIRSCSSLDCDVLGTYPVNTDLSLPYKNFDELPDWISFSLPDDKGVIQTGYINKITLGEKRVENVSDNNDPLPQTIIKNDKSPLKEKTLTEIIKEWSPSIAQIVCTNDNTNFSLGSGTFVNLKYANTDNRTSVLLTNAHVVVSEGYRYKYCSFSLTGDSLSYSLDTTTFDYSYTQDVEYISTSKSSALNPGVTMPLAKQMNKCKEIADIGDSVVILGYPTAGGTDGAITATEGIISSYDGQYYVTSAKIDHGNSGGAAILVKDSCYLGIPTWVTSGGLESYGRILMHSSFINN